MAMLAQTAPDQWEITAIVDLGGVNVPMTVRFHADNAAWLEARVAEFAASQRTAGEQSRGPDQLSVKVGGTEYEPSLIVQNTLADGSSGGTLYLTVAEAAEVLEQWAEEREGL